MQIAFQDTFQTLFRERPHVWSLTRALEMETLRGLELLSPVLDLGCGDGFLVKKLFPKKIEVGLDLDVHEVIKAEMAGAYGKLLVGDIEKLPLADCSFQTVFSISVFEHLSNLEKSFAETFRILKKGGTFIINVPNDNLMRWLFFATMKGGDYQKKRVIDELSIRHIFPTKKWVEFLERAGFEVIAVRECVSRPVVEIFDIEHFLREKNKRPGAGSSVKEKFKKNLPRFFEFLKKMKNIIRRPLPNYLQPVFEELLAGDAELVAKEGGAVATVAGGKS